MTHILSIHKFNITFFCFIYNRRAIFFFSRPSAKVDHIRILLWKVRLFYMNGRLLFFEVSPFFKQLIQQDVIFFLIQDLNWNKIPMLKAVHTLVG